MTTKFAVLGIKDTSVLTSAWLSSDGVHTEQESALLGSWQGECDTYQEALALVEEILPQFRRASILPIFVAEIEEKPQANKYNIVLLAPPIETFPDVKRVYIHRNTYGQYQAFVGRKKVRDGANKERLIDLVAEVYPNADIFDKTK